jgi:hypothetical protein
MTAVNDRRQQKVNFAYKVHQVTMPQGTLTEVQPTRRINSPPVLRQNPLREIIAY